METNDLGISHEDQQGYILMTDTINDLQLELLEENDHNFLQLCKGIENLDQSTENELIELLNRQIDEHEVLLDFVNKYKEQLMHNIGIDQYNKLRCNINKQMTIIHSRSELTYASQIEYFGNIILTNDWDMITVSSHRLLTALEGASEFNINYLPKEIGIIQDYLAEQKLLGNI